MSDTSTSRAAVEPPPIDLHTPSDVENDVDAERPDPSEAWRKFDAAVRRWKASKNEFTWLLVRQAFDQLKLSLSEDQLADLWATSKTDPELQALQSFGRRRNWLRQQRPEYKKAKADYDVQNSQREGRKRQMAEAQRTYRKNKRVRKGSSQVGIGGAP